MAASNETMIVPPLKMGGTLGRAAMATPSLPLIDPTLHFLMEMRAWAIHQGAPRFAKLSVCVKNADTGEKIGSLISFPSAIVATVAPEPTHDPADFDPTPLQAKILRFLLSGPKSATQVKNHTSSHMYDSVGGMPDLQELGLVEKKFTKFRLTEPIGEQFAAEIGEDDEADA